MSDHRTATSVVHSLRELLELGALDLPRPGGGSTAVRWEALAALGRRDLALARLAEGHVDAVAILGEADEEVLPGLYGVWASKAGGTGAALRDGALTGAVRFCSGAHGLDRALVVAAREDGDVLVDVDLTDPRVRRDGDSWRAIGMDASDSADVTFDAVPATRIVGPAGFYANRPGFLWGGGGVAAVWHGGSTGLVERLVRHLRGSARVDEHRLAHLGALHAALRGTAALLRATADGIDARPDADPAIAVHALRASAERTAWTVMDLLPRATGPGPLSWDRGFAQALADLQLYVRQHHAERDLAELGRLVLEARRADGDRAAGGAGGGAEGARATPGDGEEFAPQGETEGLGEERAWARA
ncbi:acyl-CoA dehydrogenase [Actinosynnema pretiosum subsp. pretiosum]|uniref:Acyl-CoA dehydrogenase n=1 Tax=Actinosynnema pretiosum subsp. pretiosum TaxID=103721 RepID=A0AA45R5M9_9PSEU|nr:Acyl-CoA dehydrogenase/oxidase domain protein [Actinosynnema pretiosum subsp. pretiosum]QUF05853.1 acyl-CoA dehydrogenase [Actinosynnema pretiosum subsp. pretiosum]